MQTNDTTAVDLPTDEDGAIITSAEFGEALLVKITYTTGPDGESVVDELGNLLDSHYEYPSTLHGPFSSEEEAQAWIDAYPEDTDVEDMITVTVNLVRPKATINQDTTKKED